MELPAPGAPAPPDIAILFGTAWLDDLHGHAALPEEFLEDAAEPEAVVGLAPRMTTGKVPGCSRRPPACSAPKGW